MAFCLANEPTTAIPLLLGKLVVTLIGGTARFSVTSFGVSPYPSQTPGVVPTPTGRLPNLLIVSADSVPWPH
jgi:hypothetical protein